MKAAKEPASNQHLNPNPNEKKTESKFLSSEIEINGKIIDIR